MENLGDYDFPHGSVLKKFEGTIYHINNMQIRPTRIQNEELHAGGMARRDATFDAENVKTGEPVILKLRSESNPTVYCTDSESPASYVAMGLNKFWEEVEIFENGSNSGYTPDCLAAVELKQDERYEYPGGYLCVLVLSKNPTHTFNVRRAMMKKKLTRSDLPLFAKRCEEMFRTFRARGRTLGMNVYLLEYEPESMKPYVYLPTFMGKFEPSQPPLPDLFEMRNIEYIIKDTFGDGAWREVFGELTFRSRE